MDPTRTDPPPDAPDVPPSGEARPAERDPAIPEAVVRKRRKLPTALVWLIPVLAIGFALWALITALQERGPTITISFKSGEGIEARKTRIKYKNVDIGEVRSVRLSDDHNSVIVTAQLTRDAEPLVVEDTRFWVVRPRVSAGSVTGLSTLLVGSHIGLDAGKSNVKTRSFVGLEQPPLLAKDLPGKQFLLRAVDLGSLDIGSPIYFRHIQVGQVTGFDLDAQGRGVNIGIFINTPYDRHVNLNSRFWFADGFDVTLDANGLKINTQSVLSILIGGIAFETLPDMPSNRPAPANSAFTVFPDRAKAMKATYSGYETYLLEFRESVRGLTIGAPVDFRGVVIGEVMSIDVKFDPATKEITVPVRIRMYTERLRGTQGSTIYRTERQVDEKPFLDQLVQRGFRAQLRTANLLTAQLYVALDFFPSAKKVSVDWAQTPPEIPTMPGSLQELQASLASIAGKLDKVPFDQIAAQLTRTLESGQRTFAKLDAESLPALRGTLDEAKKTLSNAGTMIEQIGTKTMPEAQAALAQAKKTLASIDQTLAPEAPLRRDLQESLREVGRAAQSFRVLADYLERHPEALLRGRSEDPK
jgi:paraquat-inducible protein B